MVRSHGGSTPRASFCCCCRFVLAALLVLRCCAFTVGEHQALLQLRSSPGLRARDWPRKANHCTNWTGIECWNGLVVGIDISCLRRTRLGDRNPRFAVDALPRLTSLALFNSSGFLLPGSIPDWFGLRFPVLRVLDLRSCSVNGTIPPSLGNLTLLTNLHLSDNRLDGVVCGRRWVVCRGWWVVCGEVYSLCRGWSTSK